MERESRETEEIQFKESFFAAKSLKKGRNSAIEQSNERKQPI